MDEDYKELMEEKSRILEVLSKKSPKKVESAKAKLAKVLRNL